jgi:ABC-type multidrug transport system ATPase subunit
LTIVVSTPYMDEASRCDRVALVQRGHILAIDAPAAITDSFDRPLIAVRAANRYQALLALRRYAETHSVYPFGEVLHFTDKRLHASPDVASRGVVEFLASRGIGGVDARPTEVTIEDSFMARMGVPDGESAAMETRP